VRDGVENGVAVGGLGVVPSGVGKGRTVGVGVPGRLDLTVGLGAEEGNDVPVGPWAAVGVVSGVRPGSEVPAGVAVTTAVLVVVGVTAEVELAVTVGSTRVWPGEAVAAGVGVGSRDMMLKRLLRANARTITRAPEARAIRMRGGGGG
jgi:hypothetical protein